MTKIIGYLRVSTDGQAESGYGLDVQRERIDAYAKALGIVVDDYIVDDGYTGTNLDRPGIKRLQAMCVAGEVSKIIVYRIDRLSRSQRRLLELIEDSFVANNVAFVSVSEQFDTSTPFGRAMLGMLGVFAQLDRDQIVERMTNGRKARAASGERANGDLPYGLRANVGGDGRRRTVPDEQTSTVVQRIYRMRGEGKSYQAIADALNASAIPTPKGGQRWYASAIQTILANQSTYREFGIAV